MSGSVPAGGPWLGRTGRRRTAPAWTGSRWDSWRKGQVEGFTWEVSQRAAEQRPGGQGCRPGAGALLGRGGVDVAPRRGEALLGDGQAAHGLHGP